MIYRMFRLYFRLALPVFYREMEVVGRERVPEDGPVILVGNHNNALLDPIIAGAYVDRRLRMTAKSTIGSMPVLGALARAIGVVFLHRQQDVDLGADPRRNLAALEVLVDRLAEGEAVIIFPEGRSHEEPALARFKSGAARAALDYVERGSPAGPLTILPFGLWFERKERRRSLARLAFGEPIEVEGWVERMEGAGHRELTREMQARVAALTVSYASQADARRLPRIERLIAAVGGDLRWQATQARRSVRPDDDLGSRLHGISRLVRGRARLAEVDARALATIEQRVDGFLDALEEVGVRAEDLYRERGPSALLRASMREAVTLGLGLPAAMLGMAIWALPFWLTRLVARRFRSDRVAAASWAVFGAALIYPAAIIIEAGLLLAFLPWPWALLLIASFLPAGAFAQAWLDRWIEVLRRLRAQLRLAGREAQRLTLAEEGRAIVAELAQLATSIEAGDSIEPRADVDRDHHGLAANLPEDRGRKQDDVERHG